MKTTFNEFEKAMKWYCEEGEAIKLIWEDETNKNNWRSNTKTIKPRFTTGLNLCLNSKITDNIIKKASL